MARPGLPLKYGYTLLELVFTLALALLLGGLGILNLWGARSAADSRATAELLAAEMRSARALALASQQPVGLAFPSAGGSTAASRSFYLIQGETRPRIVRVHRLGGESSQGCFLLGLWSGPGNSRSPIPTSSSTDLFDFAAWIAPYPSDPCLVFHPSGGVSSNGLCQFDQAYHIVVSQQGAFAATGPPAGSGPVSLNYFQIQETCRPYTVVVSPLGEVFVRQGLPGSDGSVRELERPGTPCLIAAPPSSPVAANNSPTINTVTLAPDPNPGTRAPGAGHQLADRDYLSARILATDPDGDPLFVTWTVTGGALCSSTEVRMEWSPSDSAWVASWEWRPPEPNWGPIDLTCTVSDHRGGTDTRPFSVTPRLDRYTGGRILFSRNTAGRLQLFEMNADGVGVRGLTPDVPLPASAGVFSPDRKKIAFFRATATYALPWHLCVINADGSGFRVLGPCCDNSPPVWSPDSLEIAYEGMGRQLRVITWDGRNDRQVSTTTSFAKTWSRDGRYLVFETQLDIFAEKDMAVSDLTLPLPNQTTLLGSPTSDDAGPWFSPVSDELVLTRQTAGQYELIVRDRGWDPASPERVVAAAGLALGFERAMQDPWRPDGLSLVYAGGDNSGWQLQRHLYQIDPSGVQPPQLLLNGPVLNPGFSPDGVYILYGASGDLYRANADGSNPVNLSRLGGLSYQSQWIR